MIKALLQSARDLIADPAKWTKHAMARNKYGYACSHHELEAVCYCSQGAVSLKLYSPKFTRLTPDQLHALRNNALLELDRAVCETMMRPMSIASYNDTHTHAEVLAVFDLAIERAPS